MDVHLAIRMGQPEESNQSAVSRFPGHTREKPTRLGTLLHEESTYMLRKRGLLRGWDHFCCLGDGWAPCGRHSFLVTEEIIMTNINFDFKLSGSVFVKFLQHVCIATCGHSCARSDSDKIFDSSCSCCSNLQLPPITARLSCISTLSFVCTAHEAARAEIRSFQLSDIGEGIFEVDIKKWFVNLSVGC